MLIKGGLVYTMEDAPKVCDIKIENGKITEIGENLVDDEVIRADGKFVFPGFIDAHCHIGMCESSIRFEGEDSNEANDPVTPHLRAIDAINPV
ncbi:MAG: amidohydrolase, partial [Erysipelotrichaceae bacterium]|nr:amidohydrolase [Erysipelotrichaceae bacterium]